MKSVSRKAAYLKEFKPLVYMLLFFIWLRGSRTVSIINVVYLGMITLYVNLPYILSSIQWKYVFIYLKNTSYTNIK
jgi:hypothetical protein